MSEVYFSLGTNLGNREDNMACAYEKIEKLIGDIRRRSAFYTTAPWGFHSENTFLNSAVCVETTLSPQEILRLTQQIERDMGRLTKSVDGIYRDRIIDIDILLYGTLELSTPELMLPHPRMGERNFVLRPLWDIISPELAAHFHLPLPSAE